MDGIDNPALVEEWREIVRLCRQPMFKNQDVNLPPKKK